MTIFIILCCAVLWCAEAAAVSRGLLIRTTNRSLHSINSVHRGAHLRDPASQSWGRCWQLPLLATLCILSLDTLCRETSVALGPRYGPQAPTLCV